MARFLSLAMAGFLVCSVGCASGRWEGDYQPPRPQFLEPDAYAQVKPVVEIPGLDDAYIAIAGGRIDDHGVYIDVLVEMREDPEMEHAIIYISSASHIGDESGKRWFTLSSTTDEAVRMLPREEPEYTGWITPLVQLLSGHLDRLSAAPGLSRYNMVVWYHTEEQLRPGTYILHVPDLHDDYPAHGRRLLGIEVFDGTEIELRYASGFNPEDPD